MTKTACFNEVGALQNETSYTHDAAGRVTREDYSPAGLYAARTYTYDEQGRKTGETYLDKSGAPASASTIVYGATGKPIKRTTTSFYKGEKRARK